jgi:hypothetical protein
MGHLSNPSPSVSTSIYSKAVVAAAMGNWVKTQPLAWSATVAWSPSLGLLLGGVDGSNKQNYSHDTYYYQKSAAMGAGGSDAIWADFAALFINGTTGGGLIYWSADGNTWTNGVGIPGGFITAGLATSGNVICATAQFAIATGPIIYSLDGKNWHQAIGLDVTHKYGGIQYSPDLGIWTALGFSGGYSATSSDGIHWNEFTVPFAFHSQGQIAWHAIAGLFIAADMSKSGSIANGQIMVSANGAAWSEVNPGPLGNLVSPQSVIYSPEMGIAVIAGTNIGIGEPVAWYSFNGSTWIPSTQLGTIGNLPNMQRFAWCPELGVFFGNGGVNGGWISAPPSSKSDFVQINTAKIFASQGYTGQPSNTPVPAGAIGEKITGQLASGSAVNLTNNVTANVTSITLTPGLWSVIGNVDVHPDATTVIGNVQQGISTVSATLGAQDTFSADTYQVTSTIDLSHVTPEVLIDVSVSTVVYLVVKATFTTANLHAYGTIVATRRG